MESRLSNFGWSEALAMALEERGEPDWQPARVASVRRGWFDLEGEHGPLEGVLGGSLRHASAAAAELPAVGDWVAYQRPEEQGIAVVQAVLPRRSRLSRKRAGRGASEQVVAANVDVALIVMGLDADFDLRRLERWLTVVGESGARPVVVLNKADLCTDVATFRAEVVRITAGAAIEVTSALTAGAAAVQRHLTPGVTGALLGSSGVGKTTLVNRLRGNEELATDAVRRRDGRGRHTTTARDLFRLPGGGLLIDNPGVREIEPWDASALDETFAEIAALAAACRFRDCRHAGEPGCAVRAAVDSGRLDAARLASYGKLQREAAALDRRRDDAARRAEERRTGRLYRSILDEKRRSRSK